MSMSHTQEQQQAQRARRWEWERIARVFAEKRVEPPLEIEVQLTPVTGITCDWVQAELTGWGRKHRMTVLARPFEANRRSTEWLRTYSATLFFLDESMNNLTPKAPPVVPKRRTARKAKKTSVRRKRK